MIEIFVIEDYKKVYGNLSGKDLTEALIKDCLCDCGVRDITIERADKGKPYVAERKDIYISVSHSGEYFLCAVSDKPVGIDIQLGRKASIEKIGKRYFSKEELKYIEENGDKGFFTIWARKEAYSKYTGNGLAEIIKGTHVIGREDVEFMDFQLEEGLYGSCCTVKGR